MAATLTLSKGVPIIRSPLTCWPHLHHAPLPRITSAACGLAALLGLGEPLSLHMLRDGRDCILSTAVSLTCLAHHRWSRTVVKWITESRTPALSFTGRNPGPRAGRCCRRSHSPAGMSQILNSVPVSWIPDGGFGATPRCDLRTGPRTLTVHKHMWQAGL